jgi:hypothetical protein
MKRLWWLLWAVVGVPMSMAQTPTLDPLIYGVSASLAFPQEIYFDLTLDLPVGEVARVVLTITPPVGAPTVVNFPADEPFAFAGEYVDVRTVWRVPNNTPFAGEIAYTWEIVTVRDRQISHRGTLAYAPPTTPSQTRTLDAGRISARMIGYTAREADALMSRVASLDELLRAHTGASPRFTWLIVNPQETFGCVPNADGARVALLQRGREQLAIPCEANRIDNALNALEGTRITLSPSDALGVDSLLRELVLAFYAPIWQAGTLPAWFKEAVLAFYRPLGAGTLYDARQALRVNRPYTLAELERIAQEDVKPTAWRHQVYSMGLFVADSYGVPAFLALAQTTRPLDEAYRALADGTLESWLATWQSWLYTAQAERAYGYSPLMVTTPTATATTTPTATRRPPTAEPTATATIAATPSRTPSRTPRPPTATVTPLPAEGFIVRPTLVPTTQGGNAPVSETLQAMIIGVGMVLMAVIAVLGVVLTRRRS